MNEIEDLFSHTGDGACTLNEDQRIVSWNEAAEALLGYTREEALGKIGWRLFAGQTLDGKSFCRPRCFLREQLEKNEAIASFNLLLRHKSGLRIPVNVSTIPIPPSVNQGKPGMLVHMWRPLHSPQKTKQLRIYLLGTTAVTRTDETAVQGSAWNRVKVRALLAYLALQEGKSVPRDRLIELLWPDLEHKEALHNLNTTVYNLRRCLEPDLKKVSNSAFVLYQSGQYLLSEAHWLDTRAFEAEIRRARRALDPSEKIDAYTTAVALYRGDFLSDLDTTDVWSRNQQVHYQLLYLVALEELGQTHELLGKDTEAETCYARALSMDSCRENTAQALVRLMLRHGRRADALKRCQQLATALEEELDAALSAETYDLMEQIRLTQ